jgi:hypothetical protein
MPAPHRAVSGVDADGYARFVVGLCSGSEGPRFQWLQPVVASPCLDDPRRSDWGGEVRHEAAGQRLDGLGPQRVLRPVVVVAVHPGGPNYLKTAGLGYLDKALR